jgi:hypothetical protein
MNQPIVLILPEEKQKKLLDKHNKAYKTNYQVKDIVNIIEYKDHTRNIDLIEIVFKDYIKQVFKEDTLEIDSFI